MPGAGSVVECYDGLRRGRVTTESPGFGRFESGSDGTIVWERSPLGIVIQGGWAACEHLRRYGRAQHFDWRELYASAQHAGEVELDGARCHTIELAPRPLIELSAAEASTSPPPDVLYVDAESLLPRRVDMRIAGMDGGPATAEVKLDDWRLVGGIRYAHRAEIKIGGFVLQLAYETFERGVEFSEGFFDPGDDVRAALAEQRAAGGKQQDDEIRVESLAERHIAAIRLTCKQADLQKTLAVLFPEVIEHVMSSGAEMAGPPLVRYYSFGEEIDLEAALPVRAPIEPAGRVKPATLPAGEAVIAWHVGPYDRLGETHERVKAWIEPRALEARSACWEEYWTDPGMEPDPAKWRTRVVRPVQEKAPKDGGRR